MASFSQGIKYLVHNRALFVDSLTKSLFRWLPDRLYLSIRYRCLMGHWIDWNNPKSFSEKLQWLKVYGFRPEYTKMVDKYAVKKHVSDRIGYEHVIPTIGLWDRPEDINWKMLPDKFVLKTTHGGGGGGIVFCKDKSCFSEKEAISILRESLDVDLYSIWRELPYKDVPKRILAEELLEDETGTLNDYKFFCFNGKVKFYKVDFGRFIEHHANYYSLDGTLLNYGELGLEPDPSYSITIPKNLSEMVSIAEELSKDTIFLRVDLYSVKGRVYFGELTFYPGSGMIPWKPESADFEIGSFMTL